MGQFKMFPIGSQHYIQMDEATYKAQNFHVRLILLPQYKIWQATDYATKYLFVGLLLFFFKKQFSNRIFKKVLHGVYVKISMDILKDKSSTTHF